MKNYKINIDKPKPSQEEILSGRNFDSVLEQYKAAPGKVIKKPFWQTGGFFGAIAAAAAGVAIVLMMNDGNEIQNPSDVQESVLTNNNDNNNVRLPDSTTPSTWTPTKRSVAPPLAGVNVPYKNYKVNANRGGTFTHTTGTKINFQPGSFVDVSGKAVTGNVEVKYSEMHDAVDFFLSGVPMQYDSAGRTWQLESAGMLEVAAFVNGEVVYLDKNKPAQVEMASAQAGTDYNLYHFDANAGNWVYQGKDEVSEMPRKDEQKIKDSVMKVLLAQRQVQMNCIHNNMPNPVDGVRPVKANPSKNRFLVDFNKDEFPEMANYQNVVFEVDESNEKFDQANYAVVWETISLSRGDSQSKYKLTLRKGIKQLKLDVYPVLNGQDYDFALADYQKKHTKYLADSAAFSKWLADRAAYGNDGAGLPMPVYNPELNRGTDVSGASAGLAGTVQRAFEISSFGIYNMDRPDMLPAGSLLELTINGPDNQLFSGYNTVYHVDREKNTLMNYHNMNPVPEFHVNTKSANLIWAVKDGELYYAENESFSKMPMAGKVTLALKKVAKKLNTAEEMRAFFRIETPDKAK